VIQVLLLFVFWLGLFGFVVYAGGKGDSSVSIQNYAGFALWV